MQNSTNNITTLEFNQNKKDLIQPILPTEEEFKKEAWKLKEEQGIKLTAALNQLSVKYGYKSFNAIKPYLAKNLIWDPNKITNPHLLVHSKNLEIEEETLFKKFIDFEIRDNEEKKVRIIKLHIPGITSSNLNKYCDKFHDYIAKNNYSIEQFEGMEDKIFLMYHKHNYTTKLKNGNYIVNGVELILNNEYIIAPDNPKKLKHRNRKCTLISIVNDSTPTTAEVKFLDTKRVGIVELIDLKNIN